jgi:hypothetical protein
MYIAPHDFYADNNVDNITSMISNLLYKMIGMKFKAWFYQYPENPFDNDIVLQLMEETGGMIFEVRSPTSEVPCNESDILSHFINKIKEKHPQLFV